MGDLVSPAELGKRLLALPEAQMRRQVLARLLAGLSDEETVVLMGEVARRGRESAAMEVSMLALATLLDSEDLGYQRHATLYEEARRQGNDLVARLLLSGGKQPGSSRPQLGEPVAEPSMPLGFRKAFARSSRRDMLDRLLHDPDASVLTILLQNPRVVERDAVTLAARRPTSAAAQRAVFSSRYASRYPVRLALVYNPYTPADLSARLLPGLPRGDIAAVAQSLDLAVTLRDAAKALMNARFFPDKSPPQLR